MSDTLPAGANALVKKPNAAQGQGIAVARRIQSPRAGHGETKAPGIGRNDIFFALFKHKKKIIVLTAVGLAAALAINFLYPVPYESDAKLLVRYLLERSTIDAMDNARASSGFAPATDNVIGSEVEILSSWDLAVQTAEAIGPKRLLPHANGVPSKEAAAGTVSSGLQTTIHKGSNIIFVAYQNRDPELATLVLNELVNRYFSKHLEVHRSAGAFDFVAQQTDQVRARLNQAEDALKSLKEKAGIISLESSTAALNSEAIRTAEEFHTAEADVAEAQARLRQMNTAVGGVTIQPGHEAANAGQKESGTDKAENTASVSPTPSPAPSDVLQKYQLLASSFQKLRQAQVELFGKYTPESQAVKLNQEEMDETQRQMRALEKKYPDLPTRVEPIGSTKGETNAASEATRLAGLKAKKDALAARLNEIQEKMKQLSQLTPQIADLQRQKELEETNYKYFEGALEKARIDEALDPSKIPNISAVQRPSPPFKVTQMRTKFALAAGVGGFAVAVVFALLKELILNARLGRPSDVEKFIGISPLMAIPYNQSSTTLAASKTNGHGRTTVRKDGSRSHIPPWEQGHFIRPYTEAIRDRLGLYFELHNLTHKPKLVGVSSFSKDAGTSTLAAGLAAALSETNGGKVLLVDVSLGPDQVHPFFKGKPAYHLNTALMGEGEINPAAENLYLAKNAGPAQLGLKKFFDLMPNMKASDFDYIIFDMPPLVQISPTWGMAPFMDKMLVVVEAEQNSRETVNRVYKRLLIERDNVSLVLNKVRSYAPKSLELDD